MTASGRLVLVATPIGNLGDLSPRASQALAEADLVCCEDTRRTRALLTHAGIKGRRLLSVHEHNEQARVAEILASLGDGAVVALVTDAGTPAVSDPGARLVAAAIGAGVEVTVVPGPSAALAALVVSGMDSDRFCFEGFLPRRGGPRRARLAELAEERRTVIVYESPLRLAATLDEMAKVLGGGRRVAVARELTKMHEQVWRGPLSEATEWFGKEPVRGEVVVVIEGAPAPEGPSDDEIRLALRGKLAAGESVRQAADSVASGLAVARRRAYSLGLAERDLLAGGRNAGTGERC